MSISTITIKFEKYPENHQMGLQKYVNKSTTWVRTHQPIRQGLDGTADGEPEDSIAEEGSESTDQKDDPRREHVVGNTGNDSDVLADVVGDSEHGDLALIETQNRFQGVRVCFFKKKNTKRQKKIRWFFFIQNRFLCAFFLKLYEILCILGLL